MKSEKELFLAVITILIVNQCCGQKELIKELLKNYDKSSRPVKDPFKPVNVTIFPWISYVQVNEPEESLKYLHLLEMSWRDEFLTWNPSEHGNVKRIPLTADRIWTPEIIPEGLIERTHLISDLSRIVIQVDYMGNIHTFTLEVITLHCHFSVHKFPYDEQECNIRYAAIATTSQQIALYSRQVPDEQVRKTIKISSQYNLTEFKTTRIETKTIGEGGVVQFDVEDYVGDGATLNFINYKLVFKRKPDYYNYVFALPGFLVSLICILGLFSPFNTTGAREEKISLGLTALLALAIMLQMVADAVPKSADGLPILGEFLLLQLLICAIGTIITVVLMHLHKTAIMQKWKVPKFLLKISCQKVDDINNLDKEKIRAETKVNEEYIRMQEARTKHKHNESETLQHVLRSVDLCLENLEEIKANIRETETDTSKEQVWNAVFDRFDSIFFVIFIIGLTLLSYLSLIVDA